LSGGIEYRTASQSCSRIWRHTGLPVARATAGPMRRVNIHSMIAKFTGQKTHKAAVSARCERPMLRQAKRA
jgi:hypothetical protein